MWEWKNDDPFGNNAPNEDPSTTGTAFKYNNRFPGQYFDQETNTSYNYFRDYDPSIGRYVQSDPAGVSGGLNNFAYVGANPLSHSDHLGLWDDAGHRYFIDKAFDFYPTALRDQIDLGSRGTDGLLYQLPQYSPLHGMTSTSYPIKEKARKGYCETVEKNMRMFNLLKTSPNPTTRRMAFRFLGVAMHEVMDTTSPSHSDFQFWDMTDLNGIARHGDFGNSLETAAIAKNYLAETRQKMLDTFNNGKAPDCDCNK